MSKVTGVMTSCNRPELLDKTLESFYETNTYPIEKLIIIDDSLEIGCNDDVLKKYSDYPIEIIYNEVRLRQIRSIDLAYSKVETPYIFHMEEDWEFLLPGYIEKSMHIMESDSDIITVWLRSPEDKTLKHKYDEEILGDTVKYRRCEVQWPNGLWNGFTLNPSLKRLSDYKRVAPYQYLPRYVPANSSGGNPLECDISVAYAQLGYYAVTLLEQHINHIGWENHII